MKRSVVLVTLATLLLAVVAYGQEAQKPAKEAPPPGQRVFFPPVGNLREAYGKSAEQTIAVVGTIYFAPDVILRPVVVQEAQSIMSDEGRLAGTIGPVIQRYYANLTGERAGDLAAEAVKSFLKSTDYPPNWADRFATDVSEALPQPVRLRVEGTPPVGVPLSPPGGGMPPEEWRLSERPFCQVLLLTSEPDLGVEVVSGLCQELARTLAESELRLAKDALSKAKARLVELEKKQAELEPRKKELEEEYKFRWPHEGGSGNPFPGDKGFTGPLHDKLAKLQELQFGNDLRSASVQAQLDYVRTTLAKESQVVDVFRPGSATGAVVPGINPVWSSLKQRLVELETESIGLKATGDRLKQMLAETQGALDDAAEYLSLKSTLLPNLRNQSTKEKAQLESLEAIVARIEREGPLPVPYVVESTRPQPELPAGAGMPTAPGMPTGPGMGPGGPGPTPKH